MQDFGIVHRCRECSVNCWCCLQQIN
jgi:hypothetical protein